MNKNRILVTGGLGLIGSTLISKLNKIEEDSYIICVDSFKKNIKWIYLQNIIIDELISYEDFENKKLEIINSVDSIYHLGACSSTTEESWQHLYQKNYRSTIEIIDLFVKSKRKTSNANKKLIIASSASTYGSGDEGFKVNIHNLEKLRPLNPYGMSKHLVDIYLKRKGYLSEVTSLKFFNIFGINEFHKENMRSIAHWGVESICKNNKIKLFKSANPKYDDGMQVRDFLDVDSAVKIMYFLGNNSKGIFNVGCGEEITWNQMANVIIDNLKQYKININVEFIDMPSYLEGKYQYYTCAEMEKEILPKELYPTKESVFQKLSEYTLDIFNYYKTN